MIIGGIQKTSTIDYPGVLSCVLFCRGCDLNCFYCHNRDLIYPFGESLDDGYIRDFLKRRAGLLDGVVLSGGEPTVQPGLAGFISELKGMGFKVKLDTNGQHPEVLEALINESPPDYIALDAKAPESEYIGICGGGKLELVAESVELLRAADRDFEVRTTLYPGLSAEMLLEMFFNLPDMPLWRLNFFGMPEKFMEKDTQRLREPALKKPDIDKILPLLKKLQPNIVY